MFRYLRIASTPISTSQRGGGPGCGPAERDIQRVHGIRGPGPLDERAVAQVAQHAASPNHAGLQSLVPLIDDVRADEREDGPKDGAELVAVEFGGDIVAEWPEGRTGACAVAERLLGRTLDLLSLPRLGSEPPNQAHLCRSWRSSVEGAIVFPL